MGNSVVVSFLYSDASVLIGGIRMRNLACALSLLLAPVTAWAWNPPVGVPVPAWPSDLDIARPSMPSPWSSEQAGVYFIDPTGCSDAGRTYGRPGAPRCSLPSSPVAGSVIVLNGMISGNKTIAFAGTSASPIWIMGYDTANKPTLNGVWDLSGSYLIVDNLAWNYTSQDGVGLGGHHIMVRDCSLANPYDASSGAGFIPYGINDILYKVTIAQMGNWQYSGTGDIDRHGVKVLDGVSDLWIVDSKFYHCHGDGIQIGDQNNLSSGINRVYVGRNVGYENFQSCFWTKNATDVIFSQNVCYGIDYPPDLTAVGQGIGGQYDPKYVWFLGNIVHDTRSGLMIASSSNGGGGPWYAIGNLFYNIQSPKMSCNSYGMGAISFRNLGGFTAIFNTFYNVDVFFALPPSSATARGNILASQMVNACSPNLIEGTLTHDYNLFSVSSYDPGTEAHRVVGDPKFVNASTLNFSLQPTSPAIGKAIPTEEPAFSAFQTRYGIDIRKDMLGVVRPQGGTWDIGAFEGSSVSSALSAPLNPRVQ